MHDDVFSVDQNPVACGLTFRPCATKARLFQAAHDLVRNRAHMSLGATRRDDHFVGDIRLAGEVDRHDVFGFVVVQFFQN